jgi:hypothetical protein
MVYCAGKGRILLDKATAAAQRNERAVRSCSLLTTTEMDAGSARSYVGLARVGEALEMYMDTSVYLAKLIGPWLVVVGVGVLLNANAYREMVVRLLHDPALMFISGAAALLIGLAIVLSHHVWVADWRVVITLIGWFSIVKGVMRLMFPGVGAAVAQRYAGSKFPVVLSGVIVIGIGGMLSYFGYFSA